MSKQTKAYRKALKANCEYIDRKRCEAFIAAGKSPRRRRQKKTRNQRRKANQFVRPDYYEYIASAKWRSKREQAMRHYGGKCFRCGKRATQVHHRHYMTLGRESMADLEALCSGCHRNEHEDKGATDPMTAAYLEIVK